MLLQAFEIVHHGVHAVLPQDLISEYTSGFWLVGVLGTTSPRTGRNGGGDGQGSKHSWLGSD